MVAGSYKTNNVLQCIDNNTTVTWTQVGAFSYNADSSTFDGTSLYRAIVCNGKLYIAVGYTNSYPDVRHIIFEHDASTNSCNTAYSGFPAGYNYDFFTYNNDLYEITTEDAGYVAINKINTVSGSKTLSDGMKQFNEDGIKKITKLFAGNYQEDIDYIEALFSDDTKYTSFGGTLDGTTSTVKFIYETGAIKTDTEEK